jgi:hypothetical protein
MYLLDRRFGWGQRQHVLTRLGCGMHGKNRTESSTADRLRRERDETYRRNREAERVRLEEKFLSGADSGWTPVKGWVDLYCRRNGRAFRVARGKDKRWKLYRIKSLEYARDLLGTYQGRSVREHRGEPPSFPEDIALVLGAGRPARLASICEPVVLNLLCELAGKQHRGPMPRS